MLIRVPVREYLREKAAESRHNEMSAYLMFIAGSVLFVGGILETLSVSDLVEWFLFVPVGDSAAPGGFLGLALTLGGLALAVFGLIAGTYYARGRVWYLRELRSTEVTEEFTATRRGRKNSRRVSVSRQG